jgi:hypothetical protein
MVGNGPCNKDTRKLLTEGDDGPWPIPLAFLTRARADAYHPASHGN